MSRKILTDIRAALDQAGARPADGGSRGDKKNYAERLSRALATTVANALRTDKRFRRILPDVAGKGQESGVRSARGIKKLDVNFSSVEMGLGLGVSIKTISFRNFTGASAKAQRYTKNYSRNDNELRAEAVDYHRRQPYSVLVAMIFLPMDSCSDAVKDGPSSFGSAVRYFRPRAGRRNPKNEEDRFERVFIVLYQPDEPGRGECIFFDVTDRPPKSGPPEGGSKLDLASAVRKIVEAYDERNSPPFEWAPQGQS